MQRNDKLNSAGEFVIEQCVGVDIAPSLSSIAGETFTQAFGHLYSQDDLDLFLKEHHTADHYRALIIDPASSVWWARTTDGKAVGYVVMGPCGLSAPDMPENSGELLRFYILEDYQGAGLGKRMLEVALDWLQENYAHQYLSVYSENEGAQRLYERFGFEKIHQYYFMVGHQADLEYIMKLRVTNHAPS